MSQITHYSFALAFLLLDTLGALFLFLFKWRIHTHSVVFRIFAVEKSTIENIPKNWFILLHDAFSVSAKCFRYEQPYLNDEQK